MSAAESVLTGSVLFIKRDAVMKMRMKVQQFIKRLERLLLLSDSTDSPLQQRMMVSDL